MIRDRIFSGGVAVIADSWYQAKTALDMMPIEWDVPPAHAARNTANMRAALLAAMDKPGKVRVNLGDCDRAFSGAARIVEATYSTPYLPRARMEPGNATVLVTDDRVDIWIGDQSPQETRFSASKITGIPEANVYLHLCHLGGGFGRNGNGPQAEQAIYIANQNRGTPDPPAVDARGRLRQHDLSGDGRRAPARRSRCRRLADRHRSQDSDG